MQRVEDKALAFIGAWMTGDHRGSTGDHHLMDIAADYHFPVAIGGRYRVVGAAIAHQRLRADPGCLLFAGVIGCWRQVLEGRQIPRQALADCLVVTAQPIAEPAPPLRIKSAYWQCSVKLPKMSRCNPLHSSCIKTLS